MPYEHIQIGNPRHIIDLIHANMPQWMFARELTKNSIEATEHYLLDHDLKKPAEIKIRALPLENIMIESKEIEFTKPKLSWLNYGGMSEVELAQAINIGSSVNKTNGRKENFGLGGKATICEWSDLAYITYKDGTAHLCIIGYRNGNLVVVEPIQECTEWVKDLKEYRGYDLTHDFTEVILMGKESNPTQNTLTHPFGKDKKKENQSLVLTSLFKRFYNLPKNIQIKFEDGKDGESTPHGAGPKSGGVIFKTWNQKFSQTEWKHPIVVLDPTTGVEYLYYYDPPNQNGDPSLTGAIDRFNVKNFSGFVWGQHGYEEYYNVIESDTLKRFLSRLGIIDGHNHFKILVKLPYDNFISQDMARTMLCHQNDADKKSIHLNDYLQSIKDFMPDAFREKIKEHNDRVAESKDIENMVRDYLKDNGLEDILLSGGSSGNGLQPDLQGSVNGKKPPIKKSISGNKKPTTKPKKPRLGGQNKYNQRTQSGSVYDVPHVEFKRDRNSPFFAEFTEDGYRESNGRDKDRLDINIDHPVIDKCVGQIQDQFDETVVEKTKQFAAELLATKLAAKIILGKHSIGTPGLDFYRHDFEMYTKGSFLTLEASNGHAELRKKLESEAKKIQTQEELDKKIVFGGGSVPNLEGYHYEQ